jgi:membrane associated rhomboid family serine protease
LPLAQYLKSRPELLDLGERMDRSARHQNIHQNIVSDPRILLSDFPVPLGDTTHTLAFPWIMLSLIGLQVILFLMEVFLTSNSQVFLLSVSLIPENIRKFEDLYTLITHQLFHADLFHLFGNIFTLWIFGDNVESRMGPRVFLAFYLISGALAGICAAIFAIDPLIPMIGASGAISAVLGSYMVLYPKEKIRILFLNSIWGVTVWKYLLFWITLQLLGFITEAVTREVSSVSFVAHVFGFIFGIAATLFLKKTKMLIREVHFYENTYFKQD